MATNGSRWSGRITEVMLVCRALDGETDRMYWAYVREDATRRAAAEWVARANAAREAADHPGNPNAFTRRRFTLVEYPGYWNGTPADLSDAQVADWTAFRDRTRVPGTVRGPRSDKIHYARHRHQDSLCGRGAPRDGWTEADDATVNASSAGVCPDCIRAYARP